MTTPDPISHAERTQHVKDQLRLFSGRKGQTNDTYTFILCPWHAEKTPSGQVFHGSGTRNPGYFRCLGCGKKTPWNDLAVATGMQPFGRVEPKDTYSTPLSIGDDEDDPIKFELHPLPKNKTWRTMDTNFLRKVGVKMMLTEFGTRMLWLPVFINGEERGFIKARLKKDPTGERPSYINKKGPWSKTHGLFPFDYSIKLMREMGSKTMVLVEGPRDALRLLSLGIPALSILGTNTWTQRKATLLELYGVERVLLMMDGDDAGIAATEKIAPEIRGLMTLTTIKLWRVKNNPYYEYEKITDLEGKKAFKSKLWDPGNCPEHVLLRLKKKYFSTTELE